MVEDMLVTTQHPYVILRVPSTSLILGLCILKWVVNWTTITTCWPSGDIAVLLLVQKWYSRLNKKAFQILVYGVSNVDGINWSLKSSNNNRLEKNRENLNSYLIHSRLLGITCLLKPFNCHIQAVVTARTFARSLEPFNLNIPQTGLSLIPPFPSTLLPLGPAPSPESLSPPSPSTLFAFASDPMGSPGDFLGSTVAWSWLSFQ